VLLTVKIDRLGHGAYGGSCEQFLAARFVDEVEIPVYLCDSILTPSAYGGLFAGSTDAAKELKTSAARFVVPTEIARNREDVECTLLRSILLEEQR
jgi:hypothetical protein